MRRWNINLVVILAFLTGIYLLVSPPGNRLSERGGGVSERLAPGLTSSEVMRIDIGGTLLERSRGAWRLLTGDHPGEADPSKIGPLLEALLSLRGERIAEASASAEAADLSRYGLGDSATRVLLYDMEGEIALEIEVGARAPEGGSFAVVEGNPRIWVLAQDLNRLISPPEGTWRDLEILNLPPGELSMIALEKDGDATGFTVDRDEDGDYILVTDSGDTLEPARSREILGVFEPLHARGFPDDPDAEIEPEYRVGLRTTSGGTVILLIGPEEEGERLVSSEEGGESFAFRARRIEPLLSLVD